MTTLTQQLIQLIRSKPVTQVDLQRASIMTLDALANSVGGCNSDAGRKFLRWSSEQGQDAGRDSLLAGALCHILETDDLHRASVTHPGCVVVPAVFSLARRHRLSAGDLLRAILQGFEAMCRVGMAVGSEHYRIWHNTATCGPFGSAMAAASLLGLDDDMALSALGNAGTQSSGLWEFLETGAMSKHLHAGRAAESGVIAAQLAALGFTGPPRILEGEKGFFAATCTNSRPDAIAANPNAPWQLSQTSIKPWPSCRHTHPAIDAALAIHHQLNSREIESVSVDTYQAAMDVCDRRHPDSEYAGKFSIYHCVAAALETGVVDFGSFDEASRSRLTELRSRIMAEAREPYLSCYPESWGSSVTVKLKDGSSLSEARNTAKGDPEAALSDADMVAKAHMLLAHGGLSEEQAEVFVGLILGLAEDPEADCRTAVDTFWSHLG